MDMSTSTVVSISLGSGLVGAFVSAAINAIANVLIKKMENNAARQQLAVSMGIHSHKTAVEVKRLLMDRSPIDDTGKVMPPEYWVTRSALLLSHFNKLEEKKRCQIIQQIDNDCFELEELYKRQQEMRNHSRQKL